MSEPRTATGMLVAASAVLVGVDGTPAGWDALAQAEDELATRATSDLPRWMIVCRIYPPEMAPGLSSTPDNAWWEATDPVFARRLRQTRIRFPLDIIEAVACAGDLDAELIRIGTPGQIVFGAGTRDQPRYIEQSGYREQ